VTDVRVLKMRYCETIRPETLERIFPHGFLASIWSTPACWRPP
jgi:hypothetical protein